MTHRRRQVFLCLLADRTIRSHCMHVDCKTHENKDTIATMSIDDRDGCDDDDDKGSHV